MVHEGQILELAEGRCKCAKENESTRSGKGYATPKSSSYGEVLNENPSPIPVPEPVPTDNSLPPSNQENMLPTAFSVATLWILVLIPDED